MRKKNGCHLPILLSDGSVEARYKTPSIPQWYVIDASGRVCFLLDGYTKEGYFLKKLNWMITTALK